MKNRLRLENDERTALRAALRLMDGMFHYNPDSGRYECEMEGVTMALEVGAYQAVGRVRERLASPRMADGTCLLL